MNETAKKLRDITQNAGVTPGSGKPYSVIATIKSAFGFDSILAAGVLLQFMAAIADELDELQAKANDANNLRQKLDSAEKKAERRKKQVEHTEDAIRERNARLKMRAELLEQAVNENRELRKQVPSERERAILDMWPKWSNGDYCMFGDLWTAQPYGEREPKQLTKLSILSPKLLEEWDQAQGENFAYEWNFLRPADTTYRPEKAEPPAPKVLDADGVEIKLGDTVWHEDGSEQLVEKLNRYGARCFDGDKRRTFDPKYLTHTRPDSWERLEMDASKETCFYFGYEDKLCGDGAGCPANKLGNCSKLKAADIVRRAKALAGAEVSE